MWFGYTRQLITYGNLLIYYVCMNITWYINWLQNVSYWFLMSSYQTWIRVKMSLYILSTSFFSLFYSSKQMERNFPISSHPNNAYFHLTSLRFLTSPIYFALISFLPTSLVSQTMHKYRHLVYIWDLRLLSMARAYDAMSLYDNIFNLFCLHKET